MSNYSITLSQQIGISGLDSNTGNGYLQYKVLSSNGTAVVSLTNANTLEIDTGLYVVQEPLFVPYGDTYFTRWYNSNTGDFYGGDVTQYNNQSNDVLAAINTISGVGFTGPLSVSFQFNSSIGVPIPYVTFGLVGLGIATTGEYGTVTLGLTSGTYTVSAIATSGVLWTPTNITVAINTTISINGSTIPTPTAPTNPALCTPYTYVWPQTSGVLATLTLINVPEEVQGYWISNSVDKEFSQLEGLITFKPLPIGSQVLLEIPISGVSEIFILSGSIFKLG